MHSSETRRTVEQAMAYDFSGKTALVTGACKGIGRFTTISMLKAGAAVVAADISPCPRSLELFLTRSEKVHFIRTDVTDAAQVRTAVRRTRKRYGSLDFAVNNAGVFRYQALTHKWREDRWHDMIDVNLKGVWLSMKYEIPAMLDQGGGAIVNVSSIGTLVYGRGSGGRHSLAVFGPVILHDGTRAGPRRRLVGALIPP